MFRILFPLVLICGSFVMSEIMCLKSAHAEDFALMLRSQKKSSSTSTFERTMQSATWSPEETAVIVCDVWDKHHSLNAVRRMEEFVPRMNDVLKNARKRGATIIHSPSDCMPAYEDHPARQRARQVASVENKPKDVEFWCSKIPAEEQAVYPIDQSDGGADDDPAEQAHWAAELKALGRNPGLPWKMQNDLVEIDSAVDFISDRGDEVWNILESRGIQNVILVGVHTNMCVLGRPFGLRQMARNGKNVVLMRDMTDCMYNPKRWPYVDHFTGNDLIISHVERFVCPTITSDQILGGQPFASRYDTRAERDVISIDAAKSTASHFGMHWTTAATGTSWSKATQGALSEVKGPVWYRCSVRLPSAWLGGDPLRLICPDAPDVQAWVNGTKLKPADDHSHFAMPAEVFTPDDINLLVIRTEHSSQTSELLVAPVVEGTEKHLKLEGHWQFRIGDDPAWSSIPLPAKFGLGSDVLFEAP